MVATLSRLACTKIKYISGMIEAWGRVFEKIAVLLNEKVDTESNS